MTDGEVSRPRKPLPTWPILREACLLPWNRRQHFRRLLIIPVIVTALINIADPYWPEGKEPFATTLIVFIWFLPQFLIFTFFAVSCHRSVLIGESSVSRFGVRGWSMRETRFYLWILGIYALGYFFMILFGVPLAVVTAAIGTSLGNALDIMADMEHPAFLYSCMALASVPFAYVVGRLSLLLPAIAVDLRPKFTSVWSQSKGNGWRVAVLVGGIPILFIVLQGLFGSTLDWLMGVSSSEGIQRLGVYSIITSGLSALLEYMLATVEVAILSLTFKELSGWQPSEASPIQVK